MNSARSKIFFLLSFLIFLVVIKRDKRESDRRDSSQRDDRRGPRKHGEEGRKKDLGDSDSNKLSLSPPVVIGANESPRK